MIIITSVIAVMAVPTDKKALSRIVIDHWGVEFEVHNNNMDSCLIGTLQWYKTAFHPDRVIEALEKDG